ncbi:MAG: ABC transporter permease subunit [Actinomycetia bacterium]|nr:ABC transporter permease subunit [Actinomycetes bacterium]
MTTLSAEYALLGRIPPRVVRIASVVLVLVTWEVAGRAAPRWASYPWEIGAAFVDNADRIAEAFVETFKAVGVGYALSVVGGVLIGFGMARIRVVKVALDPYVAVLYSTPRITLIPLAILLIGIGFNLRVLMSVLASIFPMIINTYAAVDSVSGELEETARSFTASKWSITRTVLIPGAIPGIFVGMRVGIIRALVGVIVAEMTAGAAGVGALLLVFGRFFQSEKLFGPVLLLGLVSILLTRGLSYLERKLAPWQE